MPRTRKLLSIGHSYVVALNRRLVNEMSLLGKVEWDVTAVAPNLMYGDLRPLQLESDPSEICRLEGVPVYNSGRIHIMSYGWRLREIMQQNWDIVHCWEEPYILAGAQLAWWMPQNIPLIYRTAQSKSKNYIPPFNWLEQYSMNRAAGWICSGNTVYDALKDRQGYAKPMRLIPLGVDIKHFRPSRVDGQKILHLLNWDDSDIPVIGYLGRLVPEKGLPLLMNVLERLETPWRVLFVGTGAMESQLQTWAKLHPNQVRICTDVRHNDVVNYLNAMDILVAPSQSAKNWREQFGRMLIEAFASGIPVIGSDSGEIPYVIGQSGIVVGEKDEAGWVKAISDLLTNPSKREQLSKEGLEKVHSEFSWEIVARKYLDFFSEIIETTTSQ